MELYFCLMFIGACELIGVCTPAFILVKSPDSVIMWPCGTGIQIILLILLVIGCVSYASLWVKP